MSRATKTIKCILYTKSLRLGESDYYLCLETYEDDWYEMDYFLVHARGDEYKLPINDIFVARGIAEAFGYDLESYSSKLSCEISEGK